MAWPDDRTLARPGGVKPGARVFLSPPAPESSLQLALDRAVRAGRPTGVLMVGLSRMAAPRPHHRRICRTLLDLAAQSHGGQVFACPNGDLALLGPPTRMAEVAATLSQMFRAELSCSPELISLCTVPGEEAAVQARLDGLRDAPAAIAEDPPAPIGAIAAVGALLAGAPDGTLIRRQTAVRIAAGEMSPLYQELSFSLAALEGQIGLPIPAGADPYLFRHLAARLDEKMLAALVLSEPSGLPTLHLNLTLPGVMSDAFGELLRIRPTIQTPLSIELQLMEIVADMAGFNKARDRLRETGCGLVLDGVDDLTLMFATPAILQPDLLKLAWSPRMASLSARDRRLMQRTIGALAPGKVVLHRAETEPALSWGLAQGIHCFQGRYVDAMLAADRLRVCEYAAGCTLRQCIDRAAATDRAGREGCRNTGLLDGVRSERAVH